MTCTNRQVRMLMKTLKRYRQKVAAAKAGMDVKTARKYIKIGKLPSELKKPHDWRTRKDPFKEDWEEIEKLLEMSPRLEALTVLKYLIGKYPEKYQERHLRTLQRRFRGWRALKGKEKEIIFIQEHKPGRQSQSDYTDMNKLGITIAGAPFKHLLFHFMLVYSRWEHVSICYSESFESLVYGYEQAVWELGAVAKEHRTDNLTAAIKPHGNREAFTERWSRVMKHYQTKPSTNNPGKSQENGSIEKSHDLFKKAVDQQLMLRGSRDFKNLEAYKSFLKKLTERRNSGRQKALLKEIPALKSLPQDKWYSPKIYPVKVAPTSTVHIDRVPYSVPSRLRNYTLTAHVYPDKIKLYYGQKYLQEMAKSRQGYRINYRHIIDQLIKKPGAFEHYKYREALFPRYCFRRAYDQLKAKYPKTGHKYYLKILQAAKIYGEQRISKILEKLFQEAKLAKLDEIKSYLSEAITIPTVHISTPSLNVYDELREEENR